MAHGTLTTMVARVLQQEFDSKGFDVLHDHGQKGIDSPDKLGKLRSWFGPKYKAEAVLADLDIAVVSRATGKVCVLIEIEETTDKPKVILGDVLATLLGDSVFFQGKRNLPVGDWTTLVIIAHNSGQAHISRMLYMKQQANQSIKHLSTSNASIGQIVLDTFQDGVELEVKLRKHIQEAIERVQKSIGEDE